MTSVPTGFANKAAYADYLNMDEEELEAANELLEYTAQSAFGFTPRMASDIMGIMIVMELFPAKLAIGCIAAFGNIKENLRSNDIMDELEEIFKLTTNDKKAGGAASVNFSAVRLIGAGFCAVIRDDIPAIKKLNEKAGNPWFDTSFKDTTAGKINAQTKADFAEWPDLTLDDATKQKFIPILKTFYSSVSSGYDTVQKDAMKDRLAASMKKIKDKKDIGGKPLSTAAIGGPPVPDRSAKVEATTKG